LKTKYRTKHHAEAMLRDQVVEGMVPR